MIKSLLYLHVLGEAVDVADIPVMIIVGHVEGRRAARGGDVATRGGGSATQRERVCCLLVLNLVSSTRQSLSTCHPDGAPVLLKEVAATVTKLLAVRLIPKGLKIVLCLFVGYEENQAQELAVDAARGRQARRQKSHMPVAAICVAICADLVGIGALEDVVPVRVCVCVHVCECVCGPVRSSVLASAHASTTPAERANLEIYANWPSSRTVLGVAAFSRFGRRRAASGILVLIQNCLILKIRAWRSACQHAPPVHGCASRGRRARPPAEHVQAPAPTEGPRVVPVRRRPDSSHHVTSAMPPSYIDPKKATGNLLFIILLLCMLLLYDSLHC
jgi:hypothetical protein